MEKIEVKTYFGNKLAHIEIAAPMGVGGATYHVMVDKFYDGSITKSSIYGWQVHLHPTTILQGDDVAVIIELIEEHLTE